MRFRALAIFLTALGVIGHPCAPARAQSTSEHPCGMAGKLPDIDVCSRFIAGPLFARQPIDTRANFHGNRGAAYLAKGQFDNALKDFDRAIAIKPEHMNAHRNRAYVHAALGNMPLAIADYDFVIARAPTDADSYNNRGVAYARMGQEARAIGDFDRTIELKPLDSEGWFNRASANMALGQPARAIPDIDRAISLNSAPAVRFLVRGKAHLLLGNKDRAIADFRLALTAPTRNEDTLQQARAHLDALGVPYVAGVAVADAQIPRPATGQQGQATAQPLRRVALVIGNSAYATQPLANAAADAVAIANTLRDELKFDAVVLEQNLTRSQMVAALQRFQAEAEMSDVALVYYSGHGNERPGRDNFLIPTDAKLAHDYDLDDEAVSLASVQARIGAARQLAMIVLDACRSSPFRLQSNTRSGTRGLARPKPEGNMLIAFATAENDVADDGDQRHSPFTAALLRHLPTQGLEVRLMLGRVRDDVKSATRDKQFPAIYGSLGGREIYLAR